MPDTFDLFTPKDRGRFGDNESAPESSNAVARSDLIDLDLHYCGQTGKAVGVKSSAGSEWIWLPKSQIEFEMTGTGTCHVTLPKWLANEKGLI